jgi:hypothetical protein
VYSSFHIRKRLLCEQAIVAKFRIHDGDQTKQMLPRESLPRQGKLSTSIMCRTKLLNGQILRCSASPSDVSPEKTGGICPTN